MLQVGTKRRLRRYKDLCCNYPVDGIAFTEGAGLPDWDARKNGGKLVTIIEAPPNGQCALIKNALSSTYNGWWYSECYFEREENQ